MTDARREDQDRIYGQPIEAQQPGWCDGCGKRILKRELIVEHHGNWVHAEGSCTDLLDEKLAEADGASTPRGSRPEQAAAAIEVERQLEGTSALCRVCVKHGPPTDGRPCPNAGCASSRGRAA